MCRRIIQLACRDDDIVPPNSLLSLNLVQTTGPSRFSMVKATHDDDPPTLRSNTSTSPPSRM